MRRTVRAVAVATGALALGVVLAPSASAAGVGFSIVTSPNPASSQGSDLDGVSCSSPSACAAVGQETDASGFDRGLAEIWNGAGWGVTPVHLPAGTMSSELYKVSCAAATFCMAVGKYELSDNVNRPLAEYWDGSTWSPRLPVEGGSTGSVLNAVSCPTTTRCFAVGSDSTSSTGEALAERWDGTGWTLIATAAPAGQFATLGAVACTSPSACVAVGEYYGTTGLEQTLGEHWNGTHWTITRTLNRAGTQADYLNGITCTAANVCIAVGDDGTSPGVARPLIENLNGSRWTFAKAPAPGNKTYSALDGIACTSSSACIAVGADVGPSSDGKALAESWDGTSWTLDKVASAHGTTSNFLNGAYCPTSGACTFAGGYHGKKIIEQTLVEVATPGT